MMIARDTRRFASVEHGDGSGDQATAIIEGKIRHGDCIYEGHMNTPASPYILSPYLYLFHHDSYSSECC
jgi:hypothetical protein